MSGELRRLSSLATASVHERVGWITRELLDRKAADAAANSRRREIHNLHADDQEPLHRMLNAMQPGTYFRPHRHVHPPKAEGLIVLRGRVGLVTFHEEGGVIPEELADLQAGGSVVGADLRAGVWHTLVVLEPDTVVYEVKPGPYRQADDKDFAPWAPLPEDPRAAAFVADLERLFRADNKKI